MEKAWKRTGGTADEESQVRKVTFELLEYPLPCGVAPPGSGAEKAGG